MSSPSEPDSAGVELAEAGEAGQPGRADILARWQAARLAATAAASRSLGHDLRGILASALLAAERLQSHPDMTVRRSSETIIRAVERATARLADARLATGRAGPAASSARGAAPVRLRECLPARADVRIDYAAPEDLVVSADQSLLTAALTSVLADLVERGARTISLYAQREGSRWAVVMQHDGEAQRSAAVADITEWGIACDWLRVLGGDLDAGDREVVLRLDAA